MASARLEVSPRSVPAESGRAAAASPVLALLLVLALVARGVSLGVGHLDELAWLCHVATAAMALGLAVGAAPVVAGAWLFHLVWGGPMWLLDVIATGTTLPSSVAAHLGPLVLGGWWLARRPWPGPVAMHAWMIGLAAMIVARPFTDPAHNVNSGYAVWPPYDAVFPSVATLWLATTLVCLGLMIGADRLLGRWRGARK